MDSQFGTRRASMFCKQNNLSALASRPLVYAASVTREDASRNIAFEELASDFQDAEGTERFKLLIQYAKNLEPMSDSERAMENRIMGCTSQVWITAELGADGSIIYRGDSDSDISKGLCAVLIKCLSGLTPLEVLEVPTEKLSLFGFSEDAATASRTNGFYNMLEAMKKSARLLTPGAGAASVFPSLTISADAVTAQGDFALSQAKFLEPDAAAVDRLVEALSAKKIGVVAHFYMDPEVQGVLSAAAKRWPHIHISDSLVMADRAVGMAEAGYVTLRVFHRLFCLPSLHWHPVRLRARALVREAASRRLAAKALAT
ncbi:hypothetical protein CYMTET_8097, partial [Cymbomonas tetramitiformis]